MKIEIVTIHRLNNFGSAFQAMALYRYISELGYDVELLDYHPSYYKGNKLKNFIGRMLFFKELQNRERKFNSFIENNTRLSKLHYTKFTEVRDRYPKADLYIAGGDQLWNYNHICGNDDTYKLTFWNGRKISYGTSLGCNVFSNEQLQDLKSKISSYESIGVREKQSVLLLSSLGLNATWVVDPVMLYSKDLYENILIAPREIEKYVFVYLVAPSKTLDDVINFLAKECKLKIIVYSGFGHKCRCDEQKRDLGPEEVIGYIRNAEFVLSSSFHATVFSILFQKKFAVILPGDTTNERLYDLLSWTDLQDTIVSAFEDIVNIYKKKSWYTLELQQIIEERVEASKKYLQKAIKGNN